MPFYTESLGLPDTAFTLIRNLIHERTGLYYENGKGDLLTDKLSPLVIDRGFSSFLDYYYLLKYDPEASEEWKRLIDVLSVQETYFWREMDQIDALADVIVPERLSAGGAAPLRIWCAACATGEEPLTIAMALNERGLFERAPIEIVGSDASAAAIEKARRGVYKERSFRRLPERLLAKYFRKDAGSWRIEPWLHARVRWEVANLAAEDEIAHLATAGIIFCRNVFIYFSPDAVRKTLNIFSRLMPATGLLFVGASESLLRFTTDFDFQEIGGGFVYVKV